VLSLGNAFVGAIYSVALGVHAIRKALAAASGLEPKHTIRQGNRLLSNIALDMDEVLPIWLQFLLSERRNVVVAYDWTDFGADRHLTIALNMITSHGRATALMGKIHDKSTLTKRTRSRAVRSVPCRRSKLLHVLQRCIHGTTDSAWSGA